ncbi:putative DDB1- and CUL4-associated factor 12 [Monocercomonoides exilis]|uniref:putative DDB1- and CUL4-associated factor 12 n=1 Tax=Monocercomonoides exilis TaxID=2049356 RepID=UPI0035599631|nr:putative DDB1- and CUL4-associated factor 12 [Monocercomonoides exilis]|eukprot:MONOS_5070.1-p1 / transcript=MONOS_5070.1 / gene=MONOS_5070 / organism=Monocercomonoides_exilis_PA203 / gene_product=unspecified product / transcript_product=unspecified product / location=Mono_scaffold00144:6964-9816(+) / protein_length=556 / sequence_SO=supercontig / SO=protein_coding / is_pseudo=false
MSINPSGTLLASGGENPCDIAVLSLPSLEGKAICEGMNDWVFGIKWIDDVTIVGCGRDGSVRNKRSSFCTLSLNHTVSIWDVNFTHPSRGSFSSDCLPLDQSRLVPLINLSLPTHLSDLTCLTVCDGGVAACSSNGDELFRGSAYENEELDDHNVSIYEEDVDGGTWLNARDWRDEKMLRRNEREKRRKREENLCEREEFDQIRSKRAERLSVKLLNEGGDSVHGWLSGRKTANYGGGSGRIAVGSFTHLLFLDEREPQRGICCHSSSTSIYSVANASSWACDHNCDSPFCSSQILCPGQGIRSLSSLGHDVWVGMGDGKIGVVDERMMKFVKIGSTDSDLPSSLASTQTEQQCFRSSSDEITYKIGRGTLFTDEFSVITGNTNEQRAEVEEEEEDDDDRNDERAEEEREAIDPLFSLEHDERENTTERMNLNHVRRISTDAFDDSIFNDHSLEEGNFPSTNRLGDTSFANRRENSTAETTPVIPSPPRPHLHSPLIPDTQLLQTVLEQLIERESEGVAIPNSVFTLSFSPESIELFAGGGPFPASLKGNFIGLL